MYDIEASPPRKELLICHIISSKPPIQVIDDFIIARAHMNTCYARCSYPQTHTRRIAMRIVEPKKHTHSLGEIDTLMCRNYGWQPTKPFFPCPNRTNRKSSTSLEVSETVSIVMFRPTDKWTIEKTCRWPFIQSISSPAENKQFHTRIRESHFILLF